MKLTPLQKRAERKNRNRTMVDLNLVSLIDVFTILIFFLLSNVGGVELLSAPKAVKLPESVSQQGPKETVVVAVSGSEILVQGRHVASVAEAMAGPQDLIDPLKDELQALAAQPTGSSGTSGKARAVTLLGDKDIPYQLLRKVMVTAARAGFSEVSFAVRQKTGRSA